MEIFYIISVIALSTINLIFLFQTCKPTFDSVETYMDEGYLYGIDYRNHVVHDTFIACNDIRCVLENRILYNENVSQVVYSASGPELSTIYILHPDTTKNVDPLIICSIIILILSIQWILYRVITYGIHKYRTTMLIPVVVQVEDNEL